MNKKKYLRYCFQNLHDNFWKMVSFIWQYRQICLIVMEWSLKIGNNLSKLCDSGGIVSEKEKDSDVNHTSNDTIANFILPRIQGRSILLF